MRYQLDITSLSFGIKYLLLNQSVNTYAKTGIDLAMWRLEKVNDLSDEKETISGSSSGIYAGVGSDITFFNLIIIALEASYHAMSRGIENGRISLLVKYPF